MSTRRLTPLLVALAAATGWVAQPASALPRLQTAPDARTGGRIVDDRGREVLLRGVSVTSLSALWKASAMRSTLPFDRSDADAVAGMGFNVVRLAVSWSRVEPEPGRYDEVYITRIQRRIELLASRGVYTIVDLHQDAWGATLFARPGEVCAVGTQAALGWGGAPGWATLDDGAARCAGATREFSPAVRAAWTSFFADRAAADGVGVQTRYLAMLRHLAQRFAGTEALAAIDVMNEPGAVTEDQMAALGPFYSRAIRAIRAGERAGGGFRHMVVLEPSVLWNLSWAGAPLSVENAANVVYSPHVYGGGSKGEPVVRPYRSARAEAAKLGGAPVLVGAWGADPAKAGQGEDGYFPRQLALQDQAHVSSTFWTWKQSCGDPASVLSLRTRGDAWRPWAVYKMDCRAGRNTIVGPYAGLMSDLRRGYVQAAPGRLDFTRWRFRVLRAAGSRATARSGPVEAFYPGARRPRVAVHGADRARIERARGGWRITARPTGGAWRVQAYARAGR